MLRFFCIVLLFFSSYAAANDKNTPDKKGLSQGIYEAGPFSFVELNLADIILSRYRIHSEYIAIEGLAFGFSIEYQSVEKNKFKMQSSVFNSSITQYFQSLSLRKIFVRGEIGAFVNNFTNEYVINSETLKKYTNVGMLAEGMVGYRYPFLKYFESAVGLGARRYIPDFFSNNISESGTILSEHTSVWQWRVDLSLGINF